MLSLIVDPRLSKSQIYKTKNRRNKQSVYLYLSLELKMMNMCVLVVYGDQGVGATH